MPRGVYERRSAQAQKVAEAGKQEKPAPAAPKVEPVIEAPKTEPKTQFSADDFRRSVDDMSGQLLKAYARKIGISQRDVDGLTEDRLRQNCKAMLFEQLEG